MLWELGKNININKTFEKIVPLTTKTFAKENIYLKDGHLSEKEHLLKPIFCLKGAQTSMS
jgi:hypothetical protein